MDTMMTTRPLNCRNTINCTLSTLNYVKSAHNRLVGSLRAVYRRVDETRVQMHLRVMERVLAQQDVDGLPAYMREERRKNIGYLREYWMQRKFPRNSRLPYRAPYLKDESGTLCAVAYMVQQSGNGHLLDGAVKLDNNIYLGDANEGPLAQWISESGLTREEAAKVQPGYGPDKFELVAMLASLGSFVIWFGLLNVGSSYILKNLNFGSRNKKIMARVYFFLSNLASAGAIVLLLLFFVLIGFGY